MTMPWEDFSQQAQAQPSAEPGPWDDFKEQAPAERAGPFWSSKLGRFLIGTAEPVVGAGQLASHLTGVGTETMDTAARALEEQYQAARRGAGLTPESWDWWGGAGNVASPINLIPGGAIARVAGPARSLLGAAGRGAAAGAAYGAMEPVSGAGDYAEQKTSQIGSGAITGGIAGPAVETAARAVSPALNQMVRNLTQQGVELTPGQIAGGNVKRIEDVLEKVPLAGAWIRGARERSLESFNRAALNRPLDIIGERRIPENIRTGHDRIIYVEDRLGDAYRNLHNRVSGRVDDEFRRDIVDIIEASMQLPRQQAEQLTGIIDNEIVSRFERSAGHALTGEALHGTMSNLSRMASGYMRDPSFDQRRLGHALFSVRDSLYAMLERQNPGESANLRSINRAWEHFVRLRRAAGEASSQRHEGRFTPTQLGRAARSLDTSASKRSSARGEAIYQDLAGEGQAIIPSQIADSGTPERLLTQGALGIGAFQLSPQAVMAAAAIPVMYSRTGQRLLRAAMMRRPQWAPGAAEILRRYGPTVGTRMLMQR